MFEFEMEATPAPLPEGAQVRFRRLLASANAAIPAHWRIWETKRIIAADVPRPTFSLFAGLETRGGSLEWVILIDEPRREVRRVLYDVSVKGLLALTEHGYTARVRWRGYRFESVGLREALIDADPGLREVIDTEFYSAS